MSAKMELHLTSGSLTRKGSADDALVYRLDEESEARGLPAVHQAHPWAGKKVSALRDRLMIEWVMSFPESRKLLKRMVDEVTAAVRKSCKSGAAKSKSSSPTVRVDVLCCNGAQLSSCFVEKLYEHFSRDPPVVAGLKVSCVPVHGKVTSHFPEVFQSKMWLNFDPTANNRTEAQFRRDPFTSAVDFTDMLLDLGSGTAYRKTERKTYYIRCSDVSGSKADCWELSSIGYKSTSRSFRAAGIQPYSVHPLTGEAVFLLGRLTYGQLVWCDFGGLKSYRLWSEGPRLTAARECYEENLGILGTVKQLADALKDFKTNNCFKVVNVETQYVGHFVRIPYQDYPAIFKKKVREMVDKPIEVDRMKWFPLSSLKSAATIACSEQFGVTQRHVKVKALNEDGTIDESRSHNLRGPYVSTLCIADGLNFLDSIAVIAEHEHRKQSKAHSASQPHKPEEIHHHSLSREQGSDGTAGGKCVSTEESRQPELETCAGAEGIVTTSTAETEVQSRAGNLEQEGCDSDRGGGDGDDTDSVSDDASSSDHSLSSEEASETEETLIPDSSSGGKKSSLPGAESKLVGKQKKSKRNKRKHKHIFFFGMGAGSFPAMEY